MKKYVHYILSTSYCTFILGETCTSRATEFAQDRQDGLLVHEPLNYGQYKLFRSYESVADVRTGFECFLGQTGYPDPSEMYTQPNFEVTSGRYYYHELGDPPATIATKHLYPWLTDPTNSMTNYERGCQHLEQLIVPRHERVSSPEDHEGFVLRTTRVPSVNNYNMSLDNGVWGVRLETKDVYNGGLFVISVDGMPYGGAVWPAVWLLGTSTQDWIEFRSKSTGLAMKNTWPSHGEIDLIEYVNAHCEGSDGRNQVTLHTRHGCTSAVNDSLRAGVEDARCDHYDGNFGCYGKMPRNTVGSPTFNGGYFVYEWKVSHFIKGWFFESDEWDRMTAGSTDDTINTENFPHAQVEHNLYHGCSDHSMFKNMRIVINTAICGDWAGNVGCEPSDPDGITYQPPDCKASVLNYIKSRDQDVLPDSFSWNFSYIRVYT